MGRGILVDVTKCIGCGLCVSACQEANQQPEHEAKVLDQQTYTFLAQSGDTSVRRLCLHCQEPSCASVCPVGALQKTAAGPVTYDAKRCMGCRYCIAACPFSVPKYEWHSAAPRVQKCQMCATRPEGPACAEACPQGATLTGERDALIAEAKKRIAEEPDAYYPHIWGMTEAGGTSVLYIGPKSPVELGLPTNVPSGPLPALTWNALKHVPDVVTFGGVFLGGLYWLTQRKEEVAEAERKQKEGGKTTPSPEGDNEKH